MIIKKDNFFNLMNKDNIIITLEYYYIDYILKIINLVKNKKI